MPFLGWVAIAVGGLWLLSQMVTCSAPDNTPGPTTGCSASRRAVESQLKSPASANWGDCFSITAGGQQTVTLMVDSQNGFGTMIRSQWVATVRDNSVLSVTQIK